MIAQHWVVTRGARDVAGAGELGPRLRRTRNRHERLIMGDIPLISVVDDDESVRESLPDLLRELGYAARAFPSGEEFLASGYDHQTKCLILDIAMPGMSGPDLHRELQRRQKKIPIIFITGHGSETVRPLMLEKSAAECLFKPFSDSALLQALNFALRPS